MKWATDAPARESEATSRGLEAMSAAIAHRGPDGAGQWVDPRPGRHVALLHRRLAIIDLPCGSQPMGNEDGTVQVVFNGEIYNYAELRQTLRAAGHCFATDHSDTEVLVHGWEQWGEELPKKLVGMFAFALWDLQAETLFLARDRMGQKPLFYAQLDDGIVFGSTIPSVLAWPEVPRRTPREHVSLYLRLGYLPPPWTIYRDVAQLRPGHVLMVRGEMARGQAYWQTPEPEEVEQAIGPMLPNTAERTRELRRSLEEAVASQLVSDVPVTCFLSGGVDSSIVAALMQRAMRTAGGNAIHTLSVGFSERDYDETNFAAQVAAHIGSQHSRLQVDVHHEVMATLQGLMEQQLGQPFGDSSLLPTHHLSRAARHVAPVALAGDGGDELFGGYDRYRAVHWLERYSPVLRLLPRELPFGGLRLRERWRRLTYAACGGSYALGSYPRLLELFTDEEVASLFGQPFAAEAGLTEWEGVRFALWEDQHHYLPGDILYKVDSAAMAVALEVRAPFLDHRVVEASWRLPVGDLLNSRRGKWILRQTFREMLPPTVFARGKQGFAVPIGEWFRHDLRAPLHDLFSAKTSFAKQFFSWKHIERLLLEHQRQQRDHTHRLFALLMLELWWQQAHATLEDAAL